MVKHPTGKESSDKGIDLNPSEEKEARGLFDKQEEISKKKPKNLSETLE